MQELCDATVGRGGTWNQDGVIVFSPGPRAALMRVSDRGGLPAEMPGFVAESNDIYPAFLPDGRHFLFTRGSLARVQPGIYVSSLDGDGQQLLIADSSNVGYSRSGYLLHVKKRTLVAQPFDVKGLRLSGPAIHVADAVAYMDGPRLGNFAVSDTVLAYFGVGSQDRVRLDFVDRAGTRVSTIGDPDVFNDFRLSPDDRRVAFVRSDAQGTDQIWVLDVRSGTPTPLTEGPIYEGSPVWLDNRRILFSRNGGLGGVAQLAADGVDGIQSVVDQSPVGKASYDAARDGRSILYGLAQDQNRYDLWALPTAGPKAFRVPGVPPDQREVQLSRDGRWLAYVSSESGNARVYVQRFSEQPTETGTKCPVAMGAQPKWGSNGNELFYVAGGNLMVVEIQKGPTCGASAPRALFALGADALGPPAMPHRYGVTADGQHFLISRTTKEAVPIPLTVILNWAAGFQK